MANSIYRAGWSPGCVNFANGTEREGFSKTADGKCKWMKICIYLACTVLYSRSMLSSPFLLPRNNLHPLPVSSIQHFFWPFRTLPCSFPLLCSCGPFKSAFLGGTKAATDDHLSIAALRGDSGICIVQGQKHV